MERLPRGSRTTSSRWWRVSLFLLVLVPLASAQSNTDLERILGQMDTAAAKFHSTEALFVWNQYAKVVDETDTQKGRIYFRRTGNDTQMAADVMEPDKKYVVYSESKVQVYQPKIDQVTVYNTGKNKAAVESFLVLGFGGGGHEMQKSFDVRYLGTETLDGVETAKLDLVPKSDKLRNTFSHIVLWIDPARGISVQQQFFEPSGDFRLAKYSDIQVNQKIPDQAFRLKTTSKTKVVSPQG